MPTTRKKSYHLDFNIIATAESSELVLLLVSEVDEDGFKGDEEVESSLADDIEFGDAWGFLFYALIY
jgi:hypothetical protein